MRPVPAPAIIDGQEWAVRDSGAARVAYVDLSGKTMVVPMDEGPIGDLLRNHEMAHVVITPRDVKLYVELAKEFPNRTLQAVEDCRVYCALQRADIDTDVSHWPDSDCKMMTTSPLEEQARALIATKGTLDFAKIRKNVPDEVYVKVEALYSEFFAPAVARGDLPTFEDTVSLARAIHEWAKEEETGEAEGGSEGEGAEGEGDGEGGASEGTEPPATDSKGTGGNVSRPFKPGDLKDETPTPKIGKDELTVQEKAEIKAVLGDHFLGLAMRSGASGLPIPDSGCHLVTPKLAKSQKGRGLGNKRVCVDSGSVPLRLSRYATDGAVFSRVVKKGYASVLIDVSASMSLQPEDIQEIINALPHSTIACYSGSGHEGHITVVAKDGRMVEEVPRFPEANVVDMQALKWLAKHRTPRFWICDGIVTGGGDSLLTTANVLKVVNICKLNHIRRYPDLECLKARFASKNSVAYE